MKILNRDLNENYRDQNVIKKQRGFFAKIQESKISYDYRFILLKKHLGLIWVISSAPNGLDLNKMKSYFCSNLDHATKIQWSTRPLL
jgi:hypothetical protein